MQWMLLSHVHSRAQMHFPRPDYLSIVKAVNGFHLLMDLMAAYGRSRASPKRTQTPRSHSVPGLPGNHHHDMIGRTGQACCLIVRRHDRHGRVFPVGSIDTRLPHSFENQSTRRRWVRNYRFSRVAAGFSVDAGSRRLIADQWIRTFLTRDATITTTALTGAGGHHRSRCVREHSRQLPSRAQIAVDMRRSISSVQ